MLDKETLSQLHLDAEGNIIVHPVTAWLAVSIAETAVLLAIQYVDGSTGPEKPVPGQIQLALTVPQCQEVSDLLKRLATKLLSADPNKPVN